MKLWPALLVVAACSDRAKTEPEVQPEPPPPRRVIEPPAGVIRALPPHAIRATSVGPYKVGEKLSEILEQLPSGPRVVLFELPGLLHISLIRADDNAVLIGGEPQGTATFVAVVGTEVARTESGIHVGSTRAELVHALGAPLDELDRARDPRLVAPSGLRTARAVLDDDRVTAIAIVGEAGAPAPTTPPPRDDCPRPASTDKAVGACLTGAGEFVEVGDGDIQLRLPDADKAMAAFRLPNVVFAAPLRASDGKDELMVVTRTDEQGIRTWSLIGFRFDNGKITKTIDPTPLYQVSASSTRWIGAEVKDVDLYLELAAKGDAIEVGGLLTIRSGAAATRDVVVISTVSVPRHRTKAAPTDGPPAEPPDAGAREATGSAGSDRAKP